MPVENSTMAGTPGKTGSGWILDSPLEYKDGGLGTSSRDREVLIGKDICAEQEPGVGNPSQVHQKTLQSGRALFTPRRFLGHYGPWVQRAFPLQMVGSNYPYVTLPHEIYKRRCGNQQVA